MRKDVRFGLAVGGLLVVVMAVYLVIAGTSRHNASTDQVHLVTDDGAGTPAATDAPAKPEAAPVAETAPASAHPNGDVFASATPAPKADPGHADSAKPHNGDVWATALATGRLLTTETPMPGASAEASPAVVPVALTGPAPAPAGASATVLRTAVSNVSGEVDSDTDSADAGDARLASASPSTRPAGQQSHRVQSGETFSTIAAKTYGNASYWPHIARANPHVDPKHLKVGMVLTLPDPSDVKAGNHHGEPAVSRSDSHPINPARQYRVQPNDSLYKISMSLYGKSDRVDKLYQLNRQTIGSNPAHLKLGMILQLPEPPTQSAVSH